MVYMGSPIQVISKADFITNQGVTPNPPNPKMCIFLLGH